MCLGTTARFAETLTMDQAEHIFDKTCRQCDLPALTFDNTGDALCVQHATVFIAADSGGDKGEAGDE